MENMEFGWEKSECGKMDFIQLYLNILLFQTYLAKHFKEIKLVRLKIVNPCSIPKNKKTKKNLLDYTHRQIISRIVEEGGGRYLVNSKLTLQRKGDIANPWPKGL